MIKRIYLPLIILFVLFFTFSCEEDTGDCMECRMSVYEDGVLDESRTTGYVTYCNDELDEILNTDEVVNGNTVSKYECKPN